MEKTVVIPDEGSVMAETGSEITVSPDKEQSARIDTQNILRRHIKENPRKKQLARHMLWLDSLQHEYPMPYHPFKVGVYIRYYNQTRHEDYLDKHIQQFKDDIALCKNWTLVGFYVDRGMTAPRMESSKEWCRLLADCMSGKVDLIVTQKVSNVSNDADELSVVARILAAQKHPVGMYFISEDIFTLASYYLQDMFDFNMLPKGIEPLPEDELDLPMFYEGGGAGLSEKTNPENSLTDSDAGVGLVEKGGSADA